MTLCILGMFVHVHRYTDIQADFVSNDDAFGRFVSCHGEACMYVNVHKH